MPQLRSKGSRFAIVVAGIFFPLLPSNAQDSQSQIAEPAPAQTERRELYLEVFINDVSTQLVGSFTQFPDGGLAATADELNQVGLKPVDDAVGGDGLVRLDRLPNVAFRIDGPSQRLYVTTSDAKNKDMPPIGWKAFGEYLQRVGVRQGGSGFSRMVAAPVRWLRY